MGRSFLVIEFDSGFRCLNVFFAYNMRNFIDTIQACAVKERKNV